jgi:hypothetical protein
MTTFSILFRMNDGLSDMAVQWVELKRIYWRSLGTNMLRLNLEPNHRTGGCNVNVNQTSLSCPCDVHGGIIISHLNLFVRPIYTQ